jgi:hypothetical protein
VVEGRREGKGVHLASKAGLTNGIQFCFRIEFKASNQLLLDHLLHISIIVMGKASVPEREV